MNISIAIMAHPSRSIEAAALYHKIARMPFMRVALVYDKVNDEWNNGRNALRAHGDGEWHVVLQDDAIISDAFYMNLVSALRNAPTKSLVSLYTGTVRPEQERVRKGLSMSRSRGASWLSSNSLYWGVGIAIPTSDISPLIELVNRSILPYDRRLGSYFERLRRPIYYTVPSLVDHDYQIPSLLGNDVDPIPRRAHNYCADLVTFNTEVVSIV